MLLGRIEETLAGLKEKETKHGRDAAASKAEPVLEPTEQLLCAKLLLAEFESDAATKLINELAGREGLDAQMKASVDEIAKKLALYDYDGAAAMIEELL